MNTISSLKVNIACAPLRDEQVEVIESLEFFLLAIGKAYFFLVYHLFFDHLSGVKKSSIVTVVAPFVVIMKDVKFS